MSKRHCCEQWRDCTDLACAGNGTSPGEWACLKACADQTLEMNGVVDEQSVHDCKAQCALADGGVAATTDALLTCMLSRDGGPIDGARSCALECLHISSGVTPSPDASLDASVVDGSSDGAAGRSDSAVASTDSGAACVTDAQCN